MTNLKFKTLVVNSYKVLVKKIQSEFSELNFFVKRRTGESYWRVGKYIEEHLLENKNRADYGTYLFEKLERDVNRDKTTLRKILQFYRAYRIGAPVRQLSWGHYVGLITVQDKAERNKLERQIIEKDWDTQKFRKYLITKRKLTGSKDPQPIPQLKFTRGKPNTFKIIKDEDSDDVSGLSVDFGFRLTLSVSQVSGLKLKEGDFIEILREGTNRAVSKVEVSEDEIYTYTAKLKKYIRRRHPSIPTK